MSASNNLPFLVGHRFIDPYKTAFHKNQAWVVSQQTCVEKPMSLGRIDQETLNSLTAYTSSVTSNRLQSRETPYNQSFPKILAQWIKFDKNVLKFLGYFVEHVVESAYENYRIRKCHIFYYLDDDTMHIDEVREENSGIVQGYFVKRQRAEKEGCPGVFIYWADINLCSDIFLYGKKFRICDCDEFTKKFFADKGIKLNEAEKVPEINYEDKFKNVDYAQNRKNIAELKEYIEVGLKGGHPNKTLKQFLENDRKVLNFDISWFDDKYDKEEKVFKMNYYLADGKIEVREIRVNNSGKDPFPLFLHKSKLAKKPQFSYCPGLLMKEDVHYKPEDLVLGNHVVIYNRPCHIIDCDEFTRKWYKENLGVDMVAIKVKRNPPQKVIHPIPPHTGFGSEEDSLLSVYYLNPQNKIHEYVTDKFKRDKHILRFNAKLISPVPSDEERKFILSYFVRDEAIQVFEIADRNSGRLNCKFMEKSRKKNPYTNRYYSEKDIMVGNTIYLNKYTFKLLECDEYTKKYMRDNAEIFRDSDITEIIERIRTASTKYESFEKYLVMLLKEIDSQSKHYVTKEEIVEGFKKLNLYLSTQELITLSDSLKHNAEGCYSMEDLYNLIVCY